MKFTVARNRYKVLDKGFAALLGVVGQTNVTAYFSDSDYGVVICVDDSIEGVVPCGVPMDGQDSGDALGDALRGSGLTETASGRARASSMDLVSFSFPPASLRADVSTTSDSRAPRAQAHKEGSTGSAMETATGRSTGFLQNI